MALKSRHNEVKKNAMKTHDNQVLIKQTIKKERNNDPNSPRQVIRAKNDDVNLSRHDRRAWDNSLITPRHDSRARKYNQFLSRDGRVENDGLNSSSQDSRVRNNSLNITRHDSMMRNNNQDLSRQDISRKRHKLRNRSNLSIENCNDPECHADIFSDSKLFRTTSPVMIPSPGYYSPKAFQPNYSYSYPFTQPIPYPMGNWHPFCHQIPSQLAVVPVPTIPVTFLSPPLSMMTVPPSPQIIPYQNIHLPSPYLPVVPYVAGNILNPIYYPISSFAALTPDNSTDEDDIEVVKEGHETSNETVESLEYYLTLPKELFPTAKMLPLNPNPIINEMCKMKDIFEHATWILDLEFGIPKTPVTRHLAAYNVEANSIHCKNTPGAVHPGFESCSEDFKRVLLFYYDGMVSVWYRGYVSFTKDECVKNFQNWLLVPMQTLGICWP